MKLPLKVEPRWENVEKGIKGEAQITDGNRKYVTALNSCTPDFRNIAAEAVKKANDGELGTVEEVKLFVKEKKLNTKEKPAKTDTQPHKKLRAAKPVEELAAKNETVMTTAEPPAYDTEKDID